MTEHSIINLVHLTLDSLLDGISWWYEGRASIGWGYTQSIPSCTTYSISYLEICNDIIPSMGYAHPSTHDGAISTVSIWNTIPSDLLHAPYPCFKKLTKVL